MVPSYKLCDHIDNHDLWDLCKLDAPVSQISPYMPNSLHTTSSELPGARNLCSKDSRFRCATENKSIPTPKRIRIDYTRINVFLLCEVRVDFWWLQKQIPNLLIGVKKVSPNGLLSHGSYFLAQPSRCLLLKLIGNFVTGLKKKELVRLAQAPQKKTSLKDFVAMNICFFSKHMSMNLLILPKLNFFIYEQEATAVPLICSN